MRKSNAGLEWVEWFIKEWESARKLLLGSMYSTCTDTSTKSESESTPETS